MRALRTIIAASALTQEQLRKHLHYDQATGQFTRIASGKRAGCISGAGPNKRFISIRILGGRYHAHRLAWLWMTGSWPKDQIDHINLDRLDNRWVNLREATGSQNCMNRGSRSDKTCGVAKGVFYRKDKPGKDIRRWRAIIMADGRRINLGHFETHDEAAQVYAAAALELHKEFARIA